MTTVLADNHRGTETPRDPLTEKIIGYAIAVHRELGPGLLESAYEACLAHELREAGIRVERQVDLPVRYRDITLDVGYRIDLVVDNRVVIEVKAVEAIGGIHEAQLLTYLRLSKHRTGLILNFNVPVLKDGIKRMRL